MYEYICPGSVSNKAQDPWNLSAPQKRSGDPQDYKFALRLIGGGSQPKEVETTDIGVACRKIIMI